MSPHSFVAFSKPSQITIVTDMAMLPDSSRLGGAVLPTEDAIYYASQEVCKFQGHVGVEDDLSRAK